MKNLKLMLIFVLLVLAGIANAQYAQVIFKDNVSPYTTYNRVIAENPSYGTSPNPPLADRWLIQLYKTIDDTVNPLDTTGNPTGDDILITDPLNANAAQYLLFLNATGLVSMSAIRFYPAGGSQAAQGDKVYLRIFNAHTIAAATKSIQFLVPYIVPVANSNVEVDPTYGWGPWVTHVPPPNPPGPAVYVAPDNSATGLGYANQLLSWTAGTGGTPTGYHVYFGTTNPPTIEVQNLAITSYNTGALSQLTTYYWQIVPYNVDGPATGNPIWSFTTRGEQNPNVAQNPNPGNGSSWDMPNPTSYVQTLSWSAPSTGVTPTGYRIVWNGNPVVDLGNVLTTSETITAPGVYTWQIIPYYVDGGTRKDGAPLGSNRTSNNRGDAVGCPVWSFEVFAYVPGNYPVDITSTPSGATIYVNGSNSGFSTPHIFSMVEGSSADYSVQMVGWDFAPASFPVTNITGPLAQNFTGTQWTRNFQVTSTPSGAAIYVNGTNSGFTTPHTFVMTYGSSATYSLQIPGWVWGPDGYTVTNITADGSIHFSGAQLLYSVDVTSNPTGAAIYVDGINSGFVTPHTFLLTYGISANYTVQMAGYTWSPTNYQVTNITAPTSVNFIGTLLTYTVDITSVPTGAAIYVNGTDSGFTAPHQFVMNYGSSSTYSVQMAGYTWSPDFVVTNITANTSHQFLGTIVTHTVDITSTPTGAAIYVDGTNSGFTTPHQFVMNYGTSATYTAQMAGYNWAPTELVVTSITSNLSQNFVGTIITYTVDITSAPTGAAIYVNGVNSTFTTPHQFVMNYGTSATYSVQMAGYTWLPDFVITNITANTNHQFVGTIITYTVDITSAPTGASIYVNGTNSGFTAPHQFVMNYGTSATYSVQMAGYTWSSDFVVTNIIANTSHQFVGTIITHTVDITSTPTDADIYVNGVDSGFNTPHQFVMNYGMSATYTVNMTGYSWTPPSLVVTNISSNINQNFVGTLLTYTVDITSAPTGAVIYVDGVNSTFTTPHQFVMPYGSSATYTVQMAGYSWAPAQFAVNNIQANTSQTFIGTIFTYTVDITSTPSNADIFVNGVDSGFNSPHQFVMNYGTSATYTVQMAGYTWVPANFVVTNIQANTSQDFVGTINTYTVNLTSTPTDADIFVNGVDSGFNTPHQFVMNYGTSATYTLQMTGYNWAPPSLVVTNIQTNITQNFVGSLQTFNVNITSTPSNADIYVNGVDSGFNTPHVFVMNYGTSATYTVQMAGYTWVPANFVVTNIVSNLSQNFVGTIITFTVDITSTPTNADIFVNGVDSGFNTPHQFVMNYGASSTYTVQMAGYTWVPANFVVTNIQANTSQDFVGSLQTFNVNITSTPTNADIYVNGVDSGFNTPYVFVMNYGTSATYTVQMTGYTWTPPSLVVTNIQANVTQNFVGALLTYTVDITSAPTNADIFVNGTDSGFNTPHQFILNYGASATYTVQMAGYTWSPANFVVTNIQANTSQNFVGTIITYTVDITSAPSDANIFVNGTDSGFNTPHQFVMNYGTSATYTLQLTGYAFTPAQFVVTNITQNMTQNFVGAAIYLTITPETQTVTAVAGTFTYQVASNFSWTVTEEVPWFTVSPTSGTGDGSFVVTYQANTSVDPRTGEITVTAGNMTVTVDLIQSGIVANDDQIEVPFANISVYPNPFSANANIRLYVKAGQQADVKIYSVKGQLVKSVGLYNKGIHTVTWNGKDETGRKCSSGFYFIRYQSDGFNKTVKVLLMEN